MNVNSDPFDVVVIGSGIGGLGAAAALAKCGRRVLVLERHFQIGGLTQSFTRGEYTFAPGVHYLGGVGGAPGAAGRFGRLLDWLTDGRLRFTCVGSPYDVVRLPDLEFPIETPQSAFSAQLKILFPDECSTIDSYFAATDSASASTKKMFAARALPAPVSAVIRTVNALPLRRALQTTADDAVQDFRDQRLAGVLSARWALSSIPPQEAPLAAHALTTTAFYDGAYYPVGGSARFAATMGDAIRACDGELRTGATVTDIRLAEGKVTGVRLADGEEIDAPVVISAMGAQNTVAALPDGVASQWCEGIRSLEPSGTCVYMYLGFRGDIRRFGATAANVWLYESNDINKVWEHPGDEPAPNMFVSFPSLKDQSHTDSDRHTGGILAICPWEPFSAWANTTPGNRPPEYEAFKSRIEQSLLRSFKKHFPKLTPMIDFHELSTPLSQAFHVAANKGAMYGLAMSAERFRHPALRVKTPIPGLLLGGQDAAGPGLEAAFTGGYMAAASVEPSLWKRMS